MTITVDVTNVAPGVDALINYSRLQWLEVKPLSYAEAARGLGELRHHASVPALIGALSDPAADVRSGAA